MNQDKCALCGKKLGKFNSVVIEISGKAYTVCLECKEKISND